MWMDTLINDFHLGEKNLTDLTLPGTHNSGTHTINWTPNTAALGAFYSPKSKIGKYFIKPWVKTYDISIYEQLKSGFRMLDLRIVYHENVWYIHHTYTCYPLVDAIYDILKFMDETKNTYESLIILFTLANYHESIITLLDMLDVYILKDRLMNLNYMKSNNQRIIPIWNFPSNKPYPYYISAYYYIASWLNTDNPDKSMIYLESEMKKYANRDRHYIHHVYYHLTANKTTIIKDTLAKIFIPCFTIGNKRMQNKMNLYMDKLFNNSDIQHVNVILSDYQDNEFLNSIIQLNIHKFQK